MCEKKYRHDVVCEKHTEASAAEEFVVQPSRFGLWSKDDRQWLANLISRWAKQKELLHQTGGVAHGIPHTLHQIWLGSAPMPPGCHEWMESWKKFNPKWKYCLWTDESVAADLRIHNSELFHSLTNPAARSDVLRLEILYQFGGVYADVDFECLKPFDSFCETYDFFCGFSNVGAVEVNNALVGATRGHPLLKTLIRWVGRPWHLWGNSTTHHSTATAALALLHSRGFLTSDDIDPVRPPAQWSTASEIIEHTGPGFFTRGVCQFLSTMDDACEEVTAAQQRLVRVGVLPTAYFYPKPNSAAAAAVGEGESPVGEGESHPKNSPNKWKCECSLAVHHWQRSWCKEEGGEDLSG